MTVTARTQKGACSDSVTLMRVGKALAARPDRVEAAVVRETSSNQVTPAATGKNT
jgi:hypothetical protein